MPKSAQLAIDDMDMDKAHDEQQNRDGKEGLAKRMSAILVSTTYRVDSRGQYRTLVINVDNIILMWLLCIFCLMYNPNKFQLNDMTFQA